MRRIAPPTVAELRAVALTLAVGAVGGVLFAWARLPLAFRAGGRALARRRPAGQPAKGD